MMIDTHTHVAVADSGGKLLKLRDAIERLLRRDAKKPLEKILSKVHPADLGQVLEGIPEEYVTVLFLSIPNPSVAAEVMATLSTRMLSDVVREADVTRLAPILDQLAPDDLVDFIGKLDEELGAKVTSALTKDSQEELEDLLQYDPNTAGGIMTTEFFSMTDDSRVEQAVEAIRGRVDMEDVEMVYYLYVTNSHGRLMGVVSLRQLLLAHPSKLLRDVMNSRIVSTHTSDSQETVARLVDKYRLLAIPVVDEAGVLVGMVTVDDVIDVIENETTREMLAMAGTSSSELLTQSPLNIFKLRAPWLMAAFLGGVGAAFVLDQYEATLAQIIQLSAFLPIVMGMAGNVGTQAATVAVRGLATGSLKLSHFKSLLVKELSVGLMLGSFYGLMLSVVSYLMFNDFASVPNLMLTVGVSMLMNICLAAIIASSLPMLFQRLGTDPALASGPFVLTSIDVLGVINYLIVASIIFDI
ncbi:MAG: magnesium transporter [Chromatiaceae bacterium]|nr:magnesium transporter [Chromatiaceae bacterium]